MHPAHPGYTVTASLLALTVAAVLWTIGRQRWPRLVLFLVIAGVGGLAGTAIGRWLHKGAVAIINQINRATGALFGTGIAWVIVLVLVAFVVFHAIHQAITQWTLLAAAGAALSVAFVPGVAGEALVGTVALCTNLAGLLFYWPFHGHF